MTKERGGCDNSIVSIYITGNAAADLPESKGRKQSTDPKKPKPRHKCCNDQLAAHPKAGKHHERHQNDTPILSRNAKAGDPSPISRPAPLSEGNHHNRTFNYCSRGQQRIHKITTKGRLQLTISPTAPPGRPGTASSHSPPPPPASRRGTAPACPASG